MEQFDSVRCLLCFLVCTWMRVLGIYVLAFIWHSNFIVSVFIVTWCSKVQPHQSKGVCCKNTRWLGQIKEPSLVQTSLLVWWGTTLTPFWCKVLTLFSCWDGSSRFSEHPLDRLDQNRPTPLGRMATPPEDLVICSQYQWSSTGGGSEDKNPRCMYGEALSHVVNLRSQHGKSPMPPCIFSCFQFNASGFFVNRVS